LVPAGHALIIASRGEPSASRPHQHARSRHEASPEPNDLGDAYGHIALSVEDLDGLSARLAEQGIEPEKPPYHPGGRGEFRICFLQDPDGYRIELIDGEFETPEDPDT
jgi:catechol 2,3-dioxygenase-like lactoylglutathione lyase family enzyme